MARRRLPDRDSTVSLPPVSRRANSARINRRAVARTGKAQSPFVPPETWYEPEEESVGGDYQIVVQAPGEGYEHVVTPSQVRDRLAQLPAHFLEGLDVVQLSRMTRKKRTCPCYGMQWGSALYLYPMESGLIEQFVRPPRPAVRIEAEMYGGRWRHENGVWQLHWTRRSLRDFYLNNILIHELGHLLDDRNRSYVDRERYAEWFAIQYGYKPWRAAQGRRPARRRHA